jgi:predicted aldo/keto reductase-like oxidoreductase
MGHLTRRDFLKSSLVTTALAGTGAGLPAWGAKQAATDMVPLGKSGVKVTRLAFGTGTFGGRVQRELGQDAFTRLVRHAYDQGIRFFETAEAYSGMPQMLGIALKGLPRDSYRIMTKYSRRGTEDPLAKIDTFRKDVNTDYFDILLIHCVRSPNWVEETKRYQDAFDEAKSKKIILAHGASVHGLQGLTGFPGNKWLDVALMRINHAGVRMDSNQMRDTNDLGDVNQVVSQMRKIHDQGTGVLGMKLVGEGQFTDEKQREASMKFVLGLGTVDAMTIGFKSPAEVDESMARMNRLLNA